MLNNADDDTVHLYQCRESCTDENYRSPELSLAQIKNLQLRMMTFKRNGYYYTVSADMIDMYGKGLTPETSSEDLLCLITDNLRCGKGGIYPSLSSDKFNHIFCKNDEGIRIIYFNTSKENLLKNLTFVGQRKERPIFLLVVSTCLFLCGIFFVFFYA